MTWTARIKKIHRRDGVVSASVEFKDGDAVYERTFSGCCCDNIEHSSLSALIQDEINRIQNIEHFPP